MNVPLALGVPEIVIVLDAQVAETPVGKPLPPETPLFEIPVAPVVAIVILVKAVLIHKVGVVLAAAAVFIETVIVPVALTVPQPPVKGMLYSNVPLALGVPEIVIVLEAQVAETPAGKPLPPETPLFEIPVAPTVVCVIFVKTLFIHKVGVELAAVTELTEITVTTKPALDGEAQTVPPEGIIAVAVYEADVETVLEAPDPRLD